MSVQVVPGGGSFVRVYVADNGPGLTETARRRIFEPFFTTKTKGTGLGMAIAHRIVLAHGGEIALEPGEGSGARFVITLPRDGKDASPTDRAR
jgi:signal transduction histidine kinase